MSEHRTRWLAYGRKVDELTRTPMRIRPPDDDEYPDEDLPQDFQAGFRAGYHAALADIKDHRA